MMENGERRARGLFRKKDAGPVRQGQVKKRSDGGEKSKRTALSQFIVREKKGNWVSG